MPLLSIDGGTIIVEDCFDQKKAVSDIGGTYDPVERVWCVIFTVYNLSYLIRHLKNLSVDEDIERCMEAQKEKETRLCRLRDMSKEDVQVRLKVPGLNLSLYNYQKLGVMYSIANGSGVLIADEMGLGKTFQALATALFMKSQGRVQRALCVTPASLKFNWPLEIEKFTNEKYVVIDGNADQRIAQWLRDDVFFYVVNYELILEDLFGGKKLRKPERKENDDGTMEELVKFSLRLLKWEKRMAELKRRQRILGPVRRRRWDFLSIDECFGYNTLIWTDEGLLPIGYIVENKLSLSVLSCDTSSNVPSFRQVLRWIRNPLKGDMVRVTHEMGSFVCTSTHKIWTEELGYVRAGELSKWAHRTHLRILPREVLHPQEGKAHPEILLKEVLRENARKAQGCSELRVVPVGIPDPEEGKVNSKILLEGVRCGVEGILSRNNCQASQIPEKERSEDCSFLRRMWRFFHCSGDKRQRKEVLQHCLFGETQNNHSGGARPSENHVGRRANSVEQWNEGRTGLGKDEGTESRPGIQEEGIVGCGKMERRESYLATPKWGEGEYHGSSVDAVGELGNRVGNGVHRNGQKEVRRSDKFSPSSLCCGHRESKIEDCCRSGWELSQDKQMEIHRQEERTSFVSSRLESVEILESGDYERLGLSRGENCLYNLEVDGNHNYFADGVLVSNCHAIKNHGSRRTKNIKALRAGFRMALTGTPLDGKLEELHSIMGFVAPGLLGSRTRFFQRHIETDWWGKVTGYKRMSEVSARIAPFFIRRLKRDVLKDLPDKIYENIPILMSPAERKIYKALAERGHEVTEDAEAMVTIIRCKQFCNYPPMVDDGCAKTSKIDVLREVLDEVVAQNGNKAIMFSQYKKMLDILVPVLEDMGLSYLRIDGDTPKRDRAAMQKTFADDRSIDMMIGTDAMSTGLNLQAANYVINYDDRWSPSVMAQREDRTHRIGQKLVVTVINFICMDTIEERIRTALSDKNRVSSEVLGDDTDEMVLQRLGPKDMARLL